MKKRLLAAVAAMVMSSAAVATEDNGDYLYAGWKSGSIEVMENGKAVGKMNYQIDDTVINNDEFQRWAQRETSRIYEESIKITTDETYVESVMPGELHLAVRKVYGNNDIRIRYGNFEKL